MLQYDDIFDLSHRILLSYSCVKQQHMVPPEAILVEKTSTSDLKVPVNDQFILPLSKSGLDPACKNGIV